MIATKNAQLKDTRVRLAKYLIRSSDTIRDSNNRIHHNAIPVVYASTNVLRSRYETDDCPVAVE